MGLFFLPSASNFALKAQSYEKNNIMKKYAL